MSRHLPDEIIFNILLRLPVKSVLRFRCVCESWFEFFTITNLNFVKMHLNHQNKFSIMLYRSIYLPNFGSDDFAKDVNTIVYDTSSSTCDDATKIDDFPLRNDSKLGFHIWGSCNGLLCIGSSMDKPISLWNPSTKECKELPDTPRGLSNCIYGFYIQYGLGYDCVIDDYKVVRIGNFDNQRWSEVMVYTLGPNSWRVIDQKVPYELSYKTIPPRGQESVNGALHWLATSYVGSEPYQVILCFDIVNERFQEMPLPNCLDEELDTYVITLGGSLCLLNFSPLVRLDVWEMKDYGVTESWTKLFTIDQQTPVGSFVLLSAVQSFNKHAILMVKNCNALVLYEPKNGTTTTLTTHGNFGWGFNNCVYVGSLVSLNSGTCATKGLERA